VKNKYVRMALSLVIALVTAFFIHNSAREASSVEYQQAVIVTKQIKQNEPVNGRNVEVKKVPAENMPESALKEIPDNKRAAQTLYEGQFIIPEMLTESKTIKLQPKHRIYPLPVSLSGAGKIRQGDKVDVYWFDQVEQQSGVIVSGVTVHNALDSKGNKIIDKEETKIGEEVAPAVVELLVTAEQANRLNLAANNGTFTLGRYNPQSEPVHVPPVSYIPGGRLFDEISVENNNEE